MSTTPTSMYEAGLGLYAEKRHPNDRDLIKEIRDIFVASGCTEEGVARNYDAHRHIANAKDKASPVQRTHVARFTDSLLKSSPVNTLDVRGHLLPNSETEVWLGHFREHIGPFVAKNRLLER